MCVHKRLDSRDKGDQEHGTAGVGSHFIRNNCVVTDDAFRHDEVTVLVALGVLRQDQDDGGDSHVGRVMIHIDHGDLVTLLEADSGGGDDICICQPSKECFAHVTQFLIMNPDGIRHSCHGHCFTHFRQQELG